MDAIRTNGLTKAFRRLNAVDRLDMHVPEGAVYGFIGENGSGKSTTEKLICGLLVPSGGTIELYGKPNSDPAERSRLGVLIEQPACFPNSTVWANLYMQAVNLDLKHPEDEIARVLKLVRMQGAAGRKFKQCSLGMKQRIGIAQALLGRPKTLILDEPINGLDADGMRIMRETLTDLNRREGVTILISSHILGELEKIATHYGVIRGGRLIREIGAAQMAEECRGYTLVRTSDDARAFTLLGGLFPAVERTESGLRVTDAKDPAFVARLLVESGVDVGELAYRNVGLEEYYLDVMNEKGEQQ